MRTNASRVLEPMPTIPPHEMLAAELADDDEPLAELRRAIEADEMPPFYSNQPVVKDAAAGQVVHPIALYMDGVAFQRQDSVLGVWCYHLFSSRRHLIAVVRRSEMCNCGCRGWCTLYPLLNMVAWSLTSMVAGLWPAARHDGMPWDEKDSDRQDKGAVPFGWKAVCVSC